MVVDPQLFIFAVIWQRVRMSDENIAKCATPKLAFTRVEAAKAIGVSAVTVDRLTQRGLLHPSRATRRPLYSVKEIERFLKETTSVVNG